MNTPLALRLRTIITLGLVGVALLAVGSFAAWLPLLGMGALVFNIAILLYVISAFKRDSRLRTHIERSVRFTENPTTSARLDSLTSQLAALQDAIHNVPRSIVAEEKEPPSFMSPSSLPSLSPGKRHSAHTAGRVAADQDESDHERAYLRRLLAEPTTSTVTGNTTDALAWSRSVLLIADPHNPRTERLRATVGNSVDLTLVQPGQALTVDEHNLPTYIVVDTQAFTGSWSGLLNAQRTRDFRDLFTHITAVRKRGTLLAVVTPATNDHFTATLLNAADILIEGEELTVAARNRDSGEGFTLLESIAQCWASSPTPGGAR